MIDHCPSWMWIGRLAPGWMASRTGLTRSRIEANRMSDASAMTISGMITLM